MMKKMDSYKANVIKSYEIADSGKPVPLSRVFNDFKSADIGMDDITAESSVREKKEREKIQQEAEKRLIGIQEESYKKGFAAGIGHQKSELVAAMDTIAAVAAGISHLRKNVISKSEQQIVRLSIAIAEKIIGQEVATRKDVILGILRIALKNISETDGMKIRINPHDFRYMMEVKKDFLQSIDGVRNLVFEEDISIKRGGALIETMFGEVDARWENQLQEIKSAMLRL